MLLRYGDDPMLAQCCTSVVDYGPALNLHWEMSCGSRGPGDSLRFSASLVVAVLCIHIERFKADLKPVICI